MKRSLFKGPIAWMAQNPVAANLLMLVLMGGGYLVGGTIKQEVFPEFELDAVMITVPYPGASPEEVEKGIVLALEEAVRGLDGVKKMTATAGEGNASLVVELLLGTDTNRALQDVKAAIDRIRTFPEEAERPSVRLMSNRQQVIALVLYGDVQERALRELAEQARDELVQRDEITVAELDAVRRPEIAVEVPTATLRAHGLTLGQIAQKVRTTALELPAGSLKTPSGEVLLRTKERRELAHEFADVSIVSTAQGVELRLGDLGSVTDGFEDSDEFASYNGKPAAMVRVYRVGEQTPVTVADTVYDFVESFRERLPPGVGIATWRDRSQMFRDRVDLLQRNALLGLILVLVVLGLFLEVRLAFWVTLGIPISFLGALLLLPGFDVSINMISLFAFIVVLVV